jgi:hypothetical protein
VENSLNETKRGIAEMTIKRSEHSLNDIKRSIA